MKGYRVEQDGEGIAFLIFDLPGKVNVMNDDFFSAMNDIMLWLEERRETLRGVIITSAKNTFFAGGDLKLMGHAKAGQEAFLFAHFERLKGFFRKLEKLGVPVVAAINGSALGGGFELALACSRRIALRREDIVIGLPEVKFGILPGAGGVVRLTRLIGLEPALNYLLTGKQVDVDSALRDGLLDEIAEDEQSLASKARAFILATRRPVQPWDKQGPLGCHTLSARERMGLFMAPLHLRHAAEAERRAARKIVQIAAESSFLQVDAALRVETRALIELMLTPEAASLIQTFLANRLSRGAAA